MSEYKIVNRVHPTPAFAQTIAEVEAQAELDKSLPLVEQVPQNPGVLEGLKTAEASRATFVGQVGSLESWGEKVVRPFLERPIRREEFDDFKERVIRAFKDMGFDTRKFFDE